jgi:hypothetical protein
MSAAKSLAYDCETEAIEASRVIFPSPLFKNKPLEFARNVLGKRTIAKHQRKILEAYYSAARVDIVCCTGQKLGKTEVEIIVAGCDFGTVKGLEGLVIGPKSDHSGKVFWKRFCIDILAAYYPCSDCRPAHEAWCTLVETDPFDETPRPERCSKCSPLIPSEYVDHKDKSKGRTSPWLNVDNCEKGLRAPDGRSIAAHVSRSEGGQGGFSGNVRIYADECSDVDDETRRACKGNMAGGGKAIWFGNLLHLHGWFAHAFKNQQGLFTHVFQISSRLSPNIPGPVVWSDGETTPINDNAERPIPGMADREGIETLLREWKNAPNYVAARIDAKHVKQVEGQLVSMARVAAAEARWTPNGGEGILQFGVDVARMRDKLAIAARRGNTIIDIFAEALGQDDHVRGVEIVLEHGRKHRRPHERKPRLVYDQTGPEGQAFRKELMAQKADEFFDITAVQMGDPPRNRTEFDKRRDELAHGLAKWICHGAIPVNTNLQAQFEVTTSKLVEVSYGSGGRKWTVSRIPLNDELRKHLDGSSPDERNACELAVLDVDGSEPSPAPSPTSAHTPANDTDTEESPTLSHHDRYAAAYGRFAR